MSAWQLTAGGLLLLPAALWLEPPLPPLTLANVAGLAWLSLVGAALTYVLWFRGLARLGPTRVAALGFLSPLTAVLLGWVVLDQRLSHAQLAGMLLVLGGVWLSQRATPPRAAVARSS
jgi:probable blue pigment (indigoidine) exporter